MKLGLPTILLILIHSALSIAAGKCPPDAEQKAAAECARTSELAAGANVPGQSELPADAAGKVAELRALMRFNMARGFQKKSREQRDTIAAIYALHSVSLPQEYRNW